MFINTINMCVVAVEVVMGAGGDSGGSGRGSKCGDSRCGSSISGIGSGI